MQNTWITWGLVVVATELVLLVLLSIVRGRRRAERRAEDHAVVWRRAYHLGAELAGERGVESNHDALVDLLDSTNEPLLVAAALAVVVRQESDHVAPALHRAVAASRLPVVLGAQLRSADTNTVVEALEVVEVLRLHSLLGEAAILTRHDDPLIVRAACDAVVALDPSIGIGILVGLVDDGESWVIDALGRATHGYDELKHGAVPLSPGQWKNAPLLAQHAFADGAEPTAGTVGHAIAALVGALEDPSPSRRLSAVTALSAAIDHPAAQLALAGALGSSERMIRFATAANLSESAIGREILRRSANTPDGSDAARMASEILWLTSADEQPALHLVGS